MFILAMGVVCRRENGEWVKRSVGASLASGSRELLAECGLLGQVWRVGQRNCRRVWSVGVKRASGSKELSAEFGLSGQVWRVGQENCWRSLVCRVKYGEWVKEIGGGVWSVGAKRASGSKELSAEFGLSGRKCCVGQGDCRRVWSVGAKSLRGSRGQSAACGLSARKCCVGQRDCR